MATKPQDEVQEPWSDGMGRRPITQSLPAEFSEYWPPFCEVKPDGEKCEGFTRWRLRDDRGKETYACEVCAARPEFGAIPRKNRDLLNLPAPAE